MPAPLHAQSRVRRPGMGSPQRQATPCTGSPSRLQFSTVKLDSVLSPLLLSVSWNLPHLHPSFLIGSGLSLSPPSAFPTISPPFYACLFPSISSLCLSLSLYICLSLFLSLPVSLSPSLSVYQRSGPSAEVSEHSVWISPHVGSLFLGHRQRGIKLKRGGGLYIRFPSQYRVNPF